MVAKLRMTFATSRWLVAAWFSCALFLPQSSGFCGESPKKIAEHEQYDVVIAGGSTAAFAAAIAAAKSGAKTALLEPTNWVGGQLTSSGVPAVDEAWHMISGEPPLSVSKWARDPRNITTNFLTSLQAMPDCGDCWVSRFCFRPKIYLEEQLHPMVQELADHLTVYHETVLKRIKLSPNQSKISAFTAIQRFPRVGMPDEGYDVLPSRDLADWYSETPSDRFDKRVHRFVTNPEGNTVFIDATEWGEVLALCGADYLQGVEPVEGEDGGPGTCGQSSVFCFVQKINEKPIANVTRSFQADRLGYGDYRDKDNPWELIWTYRRIAGDGAPAVGDLCLQNWGYSDKVGDGGNDYPFGYLFKSKEGTRREIQDWQGGINLEVMAAAEQRAIGWHEWFRSQAPSPLQPEQITLCGEELGTGHGLAKLPYIRDTRRSIGIDGFILSYRDLSGPASQRTGTEFEDRIALGAYPCDIHPLSSCEYPDYVKEIEETLPFYVPFRALTHHKYGNLLVAGKTMAQSFLANSATRLHPIEWSSGSAAGVVAAHMSKTSKDSRKVLETIGEVQKLVRQVTPIDWTMPKESDNP